MILPDAIKCQVKTGDVVLVYTYENARYQAFIIIHSPNVAYASMIKALEKDSFEIVAMDYSIPTAIQEQFELALKFKTLSLFGKKETDSISPNTFFNPENFLDFKIRIPVNTVIDKNKLISTYLKYNVERINFTYYIK